MSFRGDVIGWKTNHHPGITTRDGQITNWPVDAPFPEPDQATHDVWAAEFDALPPVPAPLDAEELYDMLVIKGLVAPGDRPRPKPS